jgi:hypothetical protein
MFGLLNKKRKAVIPGDTMSIRIDQLYWKALTIHKSKHLEVVSHVVGDGVVIQLRTGEGYRRFVFSSNRILMRDLNDRLLFGVDIVHSYVIGDTVELDLINTVSKKSPRYIMSCEEIDLALVELEYILLKLVQEHEEHEKEHRKAVKEYFHPKEAI